MDSLGSIQGASGLPGSDFSFENTCGMSFSMDCLPVQNSTMDSYFLLTQVENLGLAFSLGSIYPHSLRPQISHFVYSHLSSNWAKTPLLMHSFLRIPFLLLTGSLKLHPIPQSANPDRFFPRNLAYDSNTDFSFH